jgi:copper chaperone
MKNIKLNIEGMSCGACVGHVTRGLQNVPGVQSAVVDLASASAQVSGEELDAAKLIEAVEEEGYQAQIAPSSADRSVLPILQSASSCGGSCCGS